MSDGDHLTIVGASTRAAAFSALRAGFKPWCVDLFGDADLRERCPVMVIPRDQYPQGFVEIVRRHAPSGPLMYSGGLENHPDVVQQLAELRPLLGNDADVLRRVRDPVALTVALQQCAPAVRLDYVDLPRDGSWLSKPLRGSGGSGIERWTEDAKPGPARFFQKVVRGLPVAAICIGDGASHCQLLGVTRQLVSEPWLHARPFAYCGSIGPLNLDPATMSVLRQIGARLVEFFGLKGIFGMDCVIQGNQPMVIEVNPRYTASVEVLEYASPARNALGGCDGLVGKAILFARAALSFPREGPWRWQQTLDTRQPVTRLPAFADIPDTGTPIERGHPILTFFVRASSEAECLERLRKQADLLDRALFAR